VDVGAHGPADPIGPRISQRPSPGGGGLDGGNRMEETTYWRRLSRRQMLRGGAVAGVGLAGAALIGCSSGGDGSTDTPAGGATGSSGATGASVATADPSTPKRGGTFIYPSNSNLLGSTDLDPHTAPATAVMQIWQSISRGL